MIPPNIDNKLNTHIIYCDLTVFVCETIIVFHYFVVVQKVSFLVSFKSADKLFHVIVTLDLLIFHREPSIICSSKLYTLR